MHIGLRTECLLKQYTGVETHAHALVEGLLDAGQQVTCFHSPSKRHPAFAGANHVLFRRPLPIPMYHALAAGFHTKCFNGVDVLHLQNPQIAFWRKPNVPVVITVHDVIPFFPKNYHTVKQRVLFRRLLPRIFGQVDAICASSDATKRDLMRLYAIPEEKIHVVHLSVPQKKVEGDKEREPFILYVGTLEPRKNIEGIIRAFADLKKQGFTHKLVLAGGKGWNYESIFAEIRNLGLSDDVIYKGYVSEKEKEELYQTAELFVWPSFYEGFGLPLVEAMMHELPVVTSRNSSIPEVVGDAAVFVDPYSSSSIAEGMASVLCSAATQKRLVRNGVVQAAKFTREKMIQRTIEVYKEVVRR